MYIVCLEHLEEAIDEFVETYGASPDVHRLNEVSFTEWQAPDRCQYCEDSPVFLVI